MTWHRLAGGVPSFLQKLSGVAATLLGLIVVVGWQTGTASLTQMAPGPAPMQYVTAVAFALSGVGLLLAVSERGPLSAVAGLLAAAIGLLSITQDLLGVSPGTDFVFGALAFLRPGDHLPSRMPPNAALCFLLSGAALFFRRAGAVRMSMATSLLGALTIALGLVAVVGYVSDIGPAFGWGRLTRMALHTAIGFVLVGAGVVARGWRDAPEGWGTQRTPVLVAAASLTVSIAVWHALVVHDRQRSFQVVESQLAHLRASIAGPLDAELRALARLAEANAGSSDEPWAALARRHLRDFPATVALERVDLMTGTAAWISGGPDAPASAPQRQQVLHAAVATRSPTIVGAADVDDREDGLLAAVPLPQPSRGGVVAVIRADRLTTPAMAVQESAGYASVLLDGVRPLAGQANADAAAAPWTAEGPLGVGAPTLRLRLWPTPARIVQLDGRMSSLILAGGLLLSAVLSSMTFFAGMSRRRERELRETARQLAESEERYRSLIDSATDIIYRADADGRFTFVNPVAARVMHWRQDALIGLHYLELVDPSERARVAAFYADQVAKRIPHTYFEFLARAADGSAVWIGQNVRLLLVDGRVGGFQAVARDITERKRADAEIAKAHDAALESDRLKSEFVANISHELRTPMNGILGLTELLLETELSREQRDHVLTVRDCGETLLVLLNDILDLSKVAAGKLEIQAVAFEPRLLVQQTVDLFAERARRKGVELICLVNHEVPDAVLADPGRVRQVLTNLLGNAVKFTDHGEITVRVSSRALEGEAIQVRVEVTDTGIGIPAEALARLFQPFVQADGSITRKYGGTGLGLVISRQLAELMGGELGVTSVPGQGSTFWFTVRAGRAVAVPRANRSPAALEGRRILLLHESEAGRTRLAGLLESRGLRVLTETTLEGTLSSLRAGIERLEPFWLVIVDVRSPGPGALDVAAAVQEARFEPTVRTILVSGAGQPGDAERARQCGAVAYLTRPVTDAQIVECLETIAARETARLVPPAAAPLVTRHTLEEQSRATREPVLVVEDNLVNQKVMIGLLRKLGYQADIAGNGLDALDALARTLYRIVMMDSQMPGMDGFATTAEIRRREGSERRTVIVAVTAHAMKGERERCLAAGMDDYLSKPVSIERLAEVMARWTAAPPGPVETARLSDVRDVTASELELDRHILEQLRDLEVDAPGLLSDVVSTFLREAPGRLQRILEAHAAGDARALERAAHALKGAAAAVGATRVARLCGEIEGGAREDLAGCAAHVALIQDALARVASVLQREFVSAA